ncbi:restriction endonuclease subunit S [uncultured Clostridium sp.]|uniref:restriction endonuclease subunit S n=1 Tax=uncultured Clostridium sp. TaxID=59620 RepID=UPI0025D4BC4B|nr:restriction endonuclease subunit S [uncultured Clostridium sp.]
MENEWSKVKLVDIIQFNPKESIKKGEIAKKVAMEKLEPFTRKISGFEEAKFTSGTKFRNGDTLLARITPCLENGKTAQVDILDKDEIGFGSTEYIVLREKLGITDNDFIYYLSISPEFRNVAIKAMNGSSGRQRVQKDVLENSEFLLPPLDEQKAIAKILSDLDEKIETNNKINKKLEEMSQAIFKQWFVDFEFPNEDGKPYKSSGGEMVESELGMIPKGWEVILLGEIVDTFNGYSYKGKELSESEDAMITIKNFDRNGGYKIDGLKEIVISDNVKPHHFVEVNDIIVAHTDLTQGAEIIGNPIMIFSKGSYEKLIMSMDTVKVKSKIKEMNNELLYFILKDYRFKQYALGYVNGTTVLHLSKSTIPQYKIALPYDKSIMNQLGDNLSPIMSKIANNFKENEKLIRLRDTLLPKLMSGEIRVPLV